MQSPTSSSDRKGFDYASLDVDTAQFVQQQTGEIRHLLKHTAEDIREIGQKLIEIKEKLKHGLFLGWIKAEFGWSERTAQQFINVAKTFKNANFADLQLAPSALYTLAAPSIPEAAREEAITRAEAGEPITYTLSQVIKQKYVLPRNKGKSSSRQRSTSSSVLKPSSTSPLTLQEETQNQKTKNFHPKQEILAIRPKELVEQPIPTEKIEVTQQVAPKHKSSFIEAGSWWSLEERHLLFCGNANSFRFQERLPNFITLFLNFPPTSDLWIHSISPKIKSALGVLSSSISVSRLREIVEIFIDENTEPEDYVVFSFLPDPELLIITHEMDCYCLIAEPDLQRCQEALSYWQAKKIRVKKVKSLRF